ncbi:MAG: hypothetical protein JSW71_22895 [Gemmatimonadota bacterium]|nr:MAG: hypothetical protein JSW71_22895 [Gemmatimonadota bacterium]
MLTVRFIHFLGSALWIGGAAAAILLAVNVRRESPVVQAVVYRLLTQVHTLVVGLGALLTLGTGIVWTMLLVQNGAAENTVPSIGVWIMQGAGLIGGALVLLVGVPTAVKLGGIAVPTDDGRLLPAVDRYSRRLVLISYVAGVLALLSLFTGVVL